MSALDILRPRRNPWDPTVIVDDWGPDSDYNSEDDDLDYALSGGNDEQETLPPNSGPPNSSPGQTPNNANREADQLSASVPKPSDEALTPATKHHPALEALRAHQAQMPEIPAKVGLGRRIAAGAMGAAAGLANTAGTRMHPIDPTGAILGIKYPGLRDRMESWQMKEQGLQKSAEIERRQEEYARSEAVQRARMAAYEAMKARANRPPVTPIPRPAPPPYQAAPGIGIYNRETGQITSPVVPKPPAQGTGPWAGASDEERKAYRDAITNRARREPQGDQLGRNETGLTANQVAMGKARARRDRRIADDRARADWAAQKKAADAKWLPGGSMYKMKFHPNQQIREKAIAESKADYDGINQQLGEALRRNQQAYEDSVADLGANDNPISAPAPSFPGIKGRIKKITRIQ